MKWADTTASSWAAGSASLAAALVVAVWTRPPIEAASFGKAFAAAALWIASTIVAAALGMALAESIAQRRPAWPAVRHLLAGLAAWALIPPVLLCWIHGLRAALIVGALVGAAMAICLRGMAPPKPRTEADSGLFALLPPPDSGWGQAFAIAACVEVALVLANRGAIFLATILAAVGAFLLVWKRYASLLAVPRGGVEQPAGRAAMAAVLALLILIPMLLIRFVPPNAVETTAEAAAKPHPEAEGESNDSYRGILLFTVKEKAKELPPVPLDRSLSPTERIKRTVIPFDGVYWYFQAPRGGIGMHPHIAQGDPVAQSIYSTGWIPLAMQAHQTLAQPVDLRSCRAMAVTVKNGDNRPGRVDMGVVLTDTQLPGKPSLYLGTAPIESTEPGHFAVKARPVEDELRFAIPDHPGVPKFDEITVFYFPDAQRSTLGARIGIEQFELQPH